jgi:hypothetical protein
MSKRPSVLEGFGARSFIAWSLYACVWGGCAEDRRQTLQPDGAVAIVTLPDDMAGKGCKSDSDCADGHCATTLHIVSANDALTAPGGYCTAGCTSDSSCGMHGACSVPAADSRGECLASCRSNDDCRAGYLCADAGRASGISLAGTCQPKPATNKLAAGVAGQACEFDADCEGGQCAAAAPLGTVYPGNYCTGRCFADADCGQGGACLVLSGGSEAGRCFEHCDADSDCTRDGYRCWPLSPGFNACYPAPASLPDQIVGSACASDSDCGGIPGTCAASLPFGNFFEYKDVAAPGGYCTLPCSLDSLCGTTGQCISAGVTGGTCLSRCTTASDCRDGYTCFAHERAQNDDDKVCIPLSSQ